MSTLTRPARFAATCALISAAVVWVAGRLPVWVAAWDERRCEFANVTGDDE